MEPLFKKGQLVKYKGGAEYRPRYRVVKSWWEATGWFAYQIETSSGETEITGEMCLVLADTDFDVKMFNVIDVKKRKSLLKKAN